MQDFQKARETPGCMLSSSHAHLGDKSFLVFGPRMWNTLPASLRLVDNLHAL